MPCRAGLESLQETRFTPWRDHAKPSSDEDRQPREKAHHGSAFIIDTGNTRKKAYWASSVVSLPCPCMWPASWPSF